MFASDEQNPDGIEITHFDEVRLRDMDVDDKVDGECGYFSVFKYKKDYLLVINAPKKSETKEFKTINEVIHYLVG